MSQQGNATPSQQPAGTQARLLADIGGTNIRLAWQTAPGAPFQDEHKLRCADFPGLQEAVQAYLDTAGIAAPPHAAFGIATPVTGDQVRMTNSDWQFSQQELQAHFGFQRFVLINDFTALALAVPQLEPGLLRQVGGGAAVQGAAIALIGPGTGLGVSGLVFGLDAKRGTPIAGEGGHATLAAQTRFEFEVLEHLRHRFGHVSAERAVSGDGLVNLFHAVRAVEGLSASEVAEPAAVSALALQENDASALRALELLCAFLGGVAGDLALTLGARGGVYLGGGIVPRLGTWFDSSPFRSRFEAKGRYTDYLKAIPCWVVDASAAPALLGAARALDLVEAEPGSSGRTRVIKGDVAN